MRSMIVGSAVLALALVTPALAQVSDDVVKIGVLTDMAGVTVDITGKGSVIAAELAVKEFGGTVLGKPVQVDLRRPPAQGRCRRDDRAAMVRRRQGRCDRRRSELGRRAGGPIAGARQEDGS